LTEKPIYILYMVIIRDTCLLANCLACSSLKT